MQNKSHMKKLIPFVFNNFVLATAATIVPSTPVYAQSVLEEVIVTARKREESL